METNMQKAILSHLNHVEQENNVKVLLAVESGSRAWGFHSAESDWDVRFVYVHQLDWYLKVNEGKDVIEHMYNDDVDLVGWELRKTLRLFQKSNPALMASFAHHLPRRRGFPLTHEGGGACLFQPHQDHVPLREHIHQARQTLSAKRRLSAQTLPLLFAGHFGLPLGGRTPIHASCAFHRLGEWHCKRRRNP